MAYSGRTCGQPVTFISFARISPRFDHEARRFLNGCSSGFDHSRGFVALEQIEQEPQAAVRLAPQPLVGFQRGFGFGAVLTSPVAQWLIDRDPEDPTSAFVPLGIASINAMAVAIACYLVGEAVFAGKDRELETMASGHGVDADVLQ